MHDEKQAARERVWSAPSEAGAARFPGARGRIKTVYMAVPKLRDPLPFLELDPSRLQVSPRRAASIRASSEHRRAVSVTTPIRRTPAERE